MTFFTFSERESGLGRSGGGLRRFGPESDGHPLRRFKKDHEKGGDDSRGEKTRRGRRTKRRGHALLIGGSKI